MDASTARGLNFEATRQFGQLYSLWRDVPEAEYEHALFAWDTSQAILEVITLSRFVLDNAHSFEFVGRDIERNDGHRRIVPLLGNDGRIAYRSRKDRFMADDGGCGGAPWATRPVPPREGSAARSGAAGALARGSELLLGRVPRGGVNPGA